MRFSLVKPRGQQMRRLKNQDGLVEEVLARYGVVPEVGNRLAERPVSCPNEDEDGFYGPSDSGWQSEA
jgi:hypothetical protein